MPFTSSFSPGLIQQSEYFYGTPSINFPSNATSSGNILINGGGLDIKNQGAQSYARFYCESSNAHYTELKSQPHALYSGNPVTLLPAYDFDFKTPNFQANVTASGDISGSISGSFNHLFVDRNIIAGRIKSSTTITALEGISGATVGGDGSSLTNLQRPISSSSGIDPSVSTNFTASNTNAGFYFRTAGNVTCSIQSSSLVTCDVGTEFEFFQTASSGELYFHTGSDTITLNSKSAKIKLAGQFSGATLKKVDTDEWDLIGDLG